MSDQQPPQLGLERVGALFNRTPTVNSSNRDTDEIEESWNIGSGKMPIIRDRFGNLPGKVVNGQYEIAMKQLRIAKDTPMALYNPEHDKKRFMVLEQRARDKGTIEPLTVVETDESTEIDGNEVSIYDVYLDIRWWHVADRLNLPVVPCTVKKKRDIPTVLLDALAADTAHKPMTLFERCMTAMILNDPPYKISHQLIAQAMHCDRSRVSRYIAAVREQHPVILSMMANDFLNMDKVEALMEVYPTELEHRLLLARYAVQTEITADGIRELGKALTADKGPIRTVLLPENPEDDGSLILRKYLDVNGHVIEKVDHVPQKTDKDRTSFYLHRRTPLGANQIEVVRHAKTLRFSLVPRRKGPPVLSDPYETAVGRLFRQFTTGEVAEIDIVTFETAILADAQHMSDEATRQDIVTQDSSPLLQVVETIPESESKSDVG